MDICGREKSWEYQIESAGSRYHVAARQLGREAPVFRCSCGAATGAEQASPVLYVDAGSPPCSHIAEAQRDLNIARQAAAQMMP